MTIAPPFPYFGGKQKIAADIVALFPAHGHYIEPYCGGLSVLMAKPAVALETVNDIDGDVMTFWRVLRDRPDELERACALTPHSRQEFFDSRNRDDADDLERARRVWVALTQGRSGKLSKTGWRFNVNPEGSTLAMTKYLSGYVSRMSAAATRLRNVSLESRPALDVIGAYGAFEGALLYVDPPYIGTSRPNASSAYQHEMNGESDHRDLAEALRGVKATVVVSGYPSALYDELYEGWNTYTIRAHTGQGNADSESERTEVLWANRHLTDHRGHGLFDWEEGAA